MKQTTLLKHRNIWKNKKILQSIYNDWYQKISTYILPGKTVELGSGSGNYKEYNKKVITSDIDPHPWLDMHFDAHTMPFKKNTLSNIVMIDVLHHLNNPVSFLNEAFRVLKKHGRIILIEPYPSLFSTITYKLFHPEPFIFSIDYYSPVFKKQMKTPWQSNQAIPYLLFFKHRNMFEKTFNHKFTIIKLEKFSFLLYPLSGGFEHKQLIPDFTIPFFKLCEILLTPLKMALAFRCFIIVEKQ